MADTLDGEAYNTLPQKEGSKERISALAGSGLWNAASKGVSQTSQLAAFLAAASILSPTEFGYFAFGSAVAILLVVLAEAGWAEFVMKTDDRPETINQVASASLVSGLAFTAIALVVAAILHWYFRSQMEAALLAMFSAWILPAALVTTYDGILVYRNRLRNQAIIRMTGEIFGLAVAIGGLLAGHGVFALVASRLTTQLINLAGCTIVVRWLPSFNLRRPFTRELFEFSRHILASRMVTFFRSYAATLAVGSFLGMAEAGYFRAAERIVAAFSELLGDPARMIGWIVFRRAIEREKADTKKAQLTQAGNMILTLLLAIAAPVYLGLPLVADGLVYFALGPEWQPAVIVICILSIKQLLLIPSYVTEPLLSVTGNVRHIPPISLLNGVVSVILIVVLSPFGLVAVALGQSLAAVVALGTTIWLQSRYGRLNWPQILRHSAFIVVAIAAMVAAVYGLTAFALTREFKPASTMALQILVGVVIYCGAMILLKPASFRSFWLLRKG